jgi:hypothetical protein
LSGIEERRIKSSPGIKIALVLINAGCICKTGIQSQVNAVTYSFGEMDIEFLFLCRPKMVPEMGKWTLADIELYTVVF